MEPLLVYPNPPSEWVSGMLKRAGYPWTGVSDPALAERDEPEDGYAGALISALDDPVAAFAACRTLRKGDSQLQPVLLIVSRACLADLELREDLFDDFVLSDASAEEVEARLELVTRKIAQRVAMPGFRKGKVPMDRVRTEFASQIEQEFLEHFLPEATSRAIQESGLNPVVPPTVTNLRFTPGEEANDENFSRALATYADVYVNDAFGTAHRAHASTVGMVKYVSSKGMGFLMEREAKMLSKLLGDVQRPFVAIIGGIKVSDKIGLLESLLSRADAVCLGGAMANTFLCAKGVPMGRSMVETSKLPIARAFLAKAEASGVQVLLPRDLVVATDAKSLTGTVIPATSVPDNLAAFDIGPDSAAEIAAVLSRAGTVFWNGPMGVFEAQPFAAGTIAVAKAMAQVMGGTTVVGGGDSVAAVHRAGVAGNITHISTGGGASLEFIEGKKLPGLAALES